MSLRNSDHGYGLVTVVLHWGTVAALVAQFVIGYLIEDASGRGRGRGRGGDSGRGRGRGGDSAEWDLDSPLVRAHIVLGVTIVLLAVTRLLWRRIAALPAWDERLSRSDRWLEHKLEFALLTLLFLTPATGLILIAVGEDDLLWLHVACHVTLYAAVGLHVAIATRRRTIDRMLKVA